MTDLEKILGALAADPNIDPAFRLGLRASPWPYLFCGCRRDGSFTCKEHSPPPGYRVYRDPLANEISNNYPMPRSIMRVIT